MAVWDWPEASTQPIWTLSPGWYPATKLLRVEFESTLWPPSDVITSPAARPAWATGPPGTTLLTVGPEALEPEPPNPLPLPLCPLEVVSSTPRKAVDPTWTVAEPWPASICRTTVRA